MLPTAVAMDYILILLSFLFAFIGLLGAVVPVLPGPPLSFVGLLMLYFCDGNDVSTTALVIAGVLAAVITVIDYIAPVWFTKKAGGSKAGVWGATIGLVIGLFLGVIGIIIGPFLGAFLGELVNETPPEKALKVAFVSFLAFIVTTGMKLLYSIVLLVMVFTEGWPLFFVW